MDELDSPIWNSLIGRHRKLAEGDDNARRYPRSFTTLAGVRDYTDECFSSLAKLMLEDELVGLCGIGPAWIPEGWQCIRSFPAWQMICEDLKECRLHDIQKLTAADVPQMKDLVNLTQPGPFSDRTIEFGTFVGIKDGQRLVAMAGERMKVGAHFDEVSAVCTHPDYQGRGYGKALVHRVASEIVERGDTPILHVRSDNSGAIHTYEKLGFKLRREVNFTVVKRPAG